MKSLRAAWDGAEQFVDRYNALLGAGQANADPQALRAELDGLFADIAAHVADRARVNALRHHRNYGSHPADLVEDMFLLYRWIGQR